jgi:3-hydroxyacyl-[acyl-carrier-protein] dehydratase
VMPGVLLLEAMAQTGAVALLSCPENRGKIAYFGGVRKCRFKQKVTPGDVVELHCELVQRRGSVGIGTAVAKVGGKIACTAELTFAVGD